MQAESKLEQQKCVAEAEACALREAAKHLAWQGPVTRTPSRTPSRTPQRGRAEPE